MRTVSLPSGAELTVNVAPFKDSKNLFQAFLKEWKGLDVSNALKNGGLAMFSSAFSSAEVERALWPCISRCLYKGEKITADSFEAEETRGDYIPLCLEVVQDNILPFTRSLFSESETQSPMTVESQPSTSIPKTS